MAYLIGTSWKMNLTSSEAGRWFDGLLPLVGDLPGGELFVLPPFTSIWVARERLRGTGIAWGAQDVHPDDSGAHTGDVSAPMLADLGCTYVEIGHSERRREYGETPELIAAKARAILRWGMRPLLCVGEPSPGDAAEVVAALQADLGRCLGGVAAADAARLVVAYEPAWAIGEGAAAASPEYVGQVQAGLRDWLTSWSRGGSSPILYGGSVDASTAPAILASGVDGLFVGRHALDPHRFAAIARAAAERSRPLTPLSRGEP